MATLEELRRWARGHYVQGLPNPLRRRGVPKPRIGGATRDFANLSRQFRISDDGTDALFLFGKFKGSTAKQLVKSNRGRTYLRWIRKQDFPDDLKEVCRYQLDLWKRESKRSK